MMEEYPPNLSHHINSQRLTEASTSGNTVESSGPPGLKPDAPQALRPYRPATGQNAASHTQRNVEHSLPEQLEHRQSAAKVHQRGDFDLGDWAKEEIVFNPDQSPKTKRALSVKHKARHSEPGDLRAESPVDALMAHLEVKDAASMSTSTSYLTTKSRDAEGTSPSVNLNGLKAVTSCPDIRPSIQAASLTPREEIGNEVKETTKSLPKISPASAAVSSARASKRPDQAIFVPKRQLEERAARQKAAAEKKEKERIVQEKANREYLQKQEAKRAAERRDRILSTKADARRTTSPQCEGHSAPRETAERIVVNDGLHVLEIMGVVAADREEEVMEWLQDIQECPIKPNIKWADSTHALAVYSSPREAHISLRSQPDSGRLWLQPYAEASRVCREIVPWELQPPTLRPKTTDVVARRLLSSALQKSDLRDMAGEKYLKAQRSALKQERLAAKVKRQKDLDEAWGSE